jgi:hypothetical protein
MRDIIVTYVALRTDFFPFNLIFTHSHAEIGVMIQLVAFNTGGYRIYHIHEFQSRITDQKPIFTNNKYNAGLLSGDVL